MQNNKSEVARLKEQIELEYQAGRNALHGTAQVAKHAFATRSTERLWSNVERLEQVAGKEVTKQFLMGL